MAEAAKEIDPYERPYIEVCSTEDRDAWLAARRTGIGASEIAAVVGSELGTRGSAFSVWARKVGHDQGDDLSELEHIQWGHLLEPIIVAEFGRRSGRSVERHCKLLRSVAHPWALATLDAFCVDINGVHRPLEIKNVGEYNAEEWAEGPPDHYWWQGQQQCLVTDTAEVTFAALLGGRRLVWIDIPRDEQAIRKIVYHGERFWERVVKRDPPAVDDSKATADALKRMFPHDDGSTVVLPMDLAEVCDEWRQLKAEAKDIERKIRGCENQLKAALGDSTIGVFPTHDSITYKEQQRAEVTIPATSFRVLRYQQSKLNKGK